MSETLPQKTQTGIQTVKGYLSQKSTMEQMARVLPKHLTPERMARVALTAILRNPKLAQADVSSFANAMLTLSQMGLEPDGRNAHLVPFNNSKRNCVEVVAIADFKGIVQLVMRSGAVQSVHADVVCENDLFEYNIGEVLQHRIDFKKPRGEPYAAYMLVRFKDGGQKSEVMSREEIESIRARSKSANAGPWVSDPREMWKKTVFKRGSKWLPLSSEFANALDAEDRDSIEVTSSVIDNTQLAEPAPQPQIEEVSESVATKSDPPKEIVRRTRKSAPAPVVDVEADTEPPLDQSPEPAKEAPKPASSGAGPGDDQLNELSEKQELVAIFLVNDCDASWALLKQTAADMKWDKSLPSLLNGKGFNDLSDDDCDKILKAKRGLKAAIDKTRKPTE